MDMVHKCAIGFAAANTIGISAVEVGSLRGCDEMLGMAETLLTKQGVLGRLFRVLCCVYSA